MYYYCYDFLLPLLSLYRRIFFLKNHYCSPLHGKILRGNLSGRGPPFILKSEEFLLQGNFLQEHFLQGILSAPPQVIFFHISQATIQILPFMLEKELCNPCTHSHILLCFHCIATKYSMHTCTMK